MADRRLFSTGRREPEGGWGRPAEGGGSPQERSDLEDVIQRIQKRLLEEHEPAELARASRARLEELVDQIVSAVAREEDRPITTRMRVQLLAEVMAELTGYGPLQPLLQDPAVSEIMVNGPHQIFIERGGRIQETDRTFTDNAHLMRIIERIVAPLGRRVDEASPMVDARLPDGSRVNVIIPPLSLKGATLTIRKFSAKALGGEDLVRLGSMSREMLAFLRACVAARLNILVSGGTGSGKTTTLNALSSFIPHGERIVTIEDAAELRLQQDHVVPLESRPANLEGRGEISIRQLLRNSLRMRPDRIIVGEVRGGEALDMLQAMNTGHDGSLGTLHANTPRDAIARLETMVLMAGMELPIRAIREQIASAVDLIVQQARLRDGSRRITHITEVQGMEGDVIVLQDVFIWEQHGLDANGKVIGEHRATGLRPRSIERMEAYGIEIPSGLFAPAAPAEPTPAEAPTKEVRRRW